ncbi:MAG: hypothetical protein ACKOEC_13815 [Acidimicrobiia bacterium]
MPAQIARNVEANFGLRAGIVFGILAGKVVERRGDYAQIVALETLLDRHSLPAKRLAAVEWTGLAEWMEGIRRWSRPRASWRQPLRHIGIDDPAGMTCRRLTPQS